MIPLNQSYRIRETLAVHTAVSEAKKRFEEWACERVCWCPADLHPSLGRPGRLHYGRSYDAAIALAQIDFSGLRVCELGARASFLAPYVTKTALSVHVSDLFGRSHSALGDLRYWRNLWAGSAFAPAKLAAETVDMRATSYKDASFDVVISFSAIEHIPGDGDTKAAREMARICRPGGFVVIGTDMSSQYIVRGSGRHYDVGTLSARLIDPSGCDLWGASDFSWEAADKSWHRSGEYEQTSCIFILRKPE